MVEKVKVVLDINIWVSILFNKTLAGKFLPLVHSGKVAVYISRDLVSELSRVLTYPKIGKLLERAGMDQRVALSAILRSVAMVSVKESLVEIRDDSADNRVLECALAARAEFIVTGDRHLLMLKRFGRTEIVSAREFLERHGHT